MSVTLVFSEPFTIIMKKWEMQVKLDKSTTLRELLLNLIEQVGDSLREILFKDNMKEMVEDLVLTINGIHFKFKGGLDTELKNGDRLNFMWNYYGG
jgi:hypothetical protein